MHRAEQPDDKGSPIAEAILRTLLYASIFDFPLTEAEIHHFLIERRATPAEVHAALTESGWLASRIEQCDGWYVLRGRMDLVATRKSRAAAAESLWPTAERYGRLLARLPFVRMVALTGSLAMRNPAYARDDIDYLILTAPGRVWLTRLLCVAVVRWARLRGVGLCPNYVLAATALHQEPHDLYLAHELAQMIPLSGHALYEAMRRANPWTNRLLPNAAQPFYATPDRSPRGVGRFAQRALEILFGGPLGSWLEDWEKRRKQRKFARIAEQVGAARLDSERVKGHFDDHGARILGQYFANLSEYNLDWALAEPMP